jgi:DNA-binding GntR family transcriptional regulator
MARSLRRIAVPEPLANFIAGELARAIEAGEYRPGERLGEAELALRFGVSRAPVREALRILTKDEVVVQRPRRGVTVVDLSPVELDEMFEVRSALYAAVVRLFTRRASPEMIAGYATLVDRVTELARDPEISPRVFAQTTQAASVFLVTQCGNARLQAMFGKITRQAYRFYAEKAHSTARHRRHLAKLVREMLAVMREGDAERASMIAWRITEANQAAARAALARAALARDDTPP